MAKTIQATVAERQAMVWEPDLVRRLRNGDTLSGGWAEIEPPGMVQGHAVGDVLLCHMRDVTWYPATGILVGSDGRAVQSSVLAAGGRNTTAPRGRKIRLHRATVFAGLGAMRNYGHFLFDGVAGLAAMADLGLLVGFPAAAAPLKTWQRQVLAQADLSALEVDAAEVHLDEVIFVTAMNHYLHRCQALVPPLVARMGGQGAVGRDAVYLSRQGYTGRILLGEAALETALTRRGVRILRPQTMAVADQITAMREASVIVAPSGAALANIIFAPQGATVIEIRPQPVREPWVDLTCAAMGLSHVVVPAGQVTGIGVPLSARLRQVPRWALRRYHYVVECDPIAVLAALEAVR